MTEEDIQQKKELNLINLQEAVDEMRKECEKGGTEFSYKGQLYICYSSLTKEELETIRKRYEDTR